MIRSKGARKIGPKELAARLHREAQFADVASDVATGEVGSAEVEAGESNAVQAVAVESFADDEDFDILQVNPRPAVKAQPAVEAAPATEERPVEDQASGEPQPLEESPAERRTRLERARKQRVADRKAAQRSQRQAEREAKRATRQQRRVERAARKTLSPEATAARRRVRELRAAIKAERARLESQLPDSGGPSLSELQEELKAARAAQYEAVAEVATELAAVRARLKELKAQKQDIVQGHPATQRVTSLRATIGSIKRTRQEALSDADAQHLSSLKKALVKARAQYQATRSAPSTPERPEEPPSLLEDEPVDWQSIFDPQAMER